MTNSLIQGMRQENNYTHTENGALTLKSTLNDVLDYYYHAPARRGKDNTQLFANAYSEDPVLALRALFYIRDIRGGSRTGERETFRQGLRYLYNNKRDVFDALVPLVFEYGRWDDILEFVDSRVVVQLVRTQLDMDLRIVVTSDKPISLLAKWMPSVNAGIESKKLAKKWLQRLRMSERQYRSILKALRTRIGIVESLMSAGRFDLIEYSKVSSNAAMLYRKAFSKRDADRYVAYLEAVKAGKTTIKASTLYPYEIVRKILYGYENNATLEAQWNALPNFAGNANALVMADVSGSMSGDPMAVSISLAMYFAERNKGQFSGYFMTFSGSPELVKVRGSSLYDRIRNISNANWNMNTNLQAAFDLILQTAVKNRVPVEEMPSMLFVVSDMEFDACVSGGTNFQNIKRKYAASGYELPKLVFWNVDSRNNQVPVSEKEEGVYLVSGLSAGTFKSALQAKATTPIDMMVEVLNSDRYNPVEEAYRSI